MSLTRYFLKLLLILCIVLTKFRVHPKPKNCESRPSGLFIIRQLLVADKSSVYETVDNEKHVENFPSMLIWKLRLWKMEIYHGSQAHSIFWGRSCDLSPTPSPLSLQPLSVTLRVAPVVGMSSQMEMVLTGSGAPLLRCLHTSTATHPYWTTPQTAQKVETHYMCSRNAVSTRRYYLQLKC